MGWAFTLQRRLTAVGGETDEKDTGWKDSTSQLWERLIRVLGGPRATSLHWAKVH